MKINLKISLKLVIAFAILIALTSTVGIVCYSSLGQITNASSIQDAANQMVSNVLDARRHEKNYIIRGDTSEIANVHTLIQTVETQSEDTKKKTTDALMIKQLDSVKSEAAAYVAAFDQYVALTNQEATADNDMVNAARSVIQKTQQANDSASLINMLQARISEKNYIIRGNSSYIDSVHTYINAIIASTNDSGIITDINSYKAAFDSYVNLGIEKTDQDSAMVGTGRKAIGSAESNSTDYGGAELVRSTIGAQIDGLEVTVNVTIIAFIAAAIATGVTMAFLITRSITRPLGMLVEDSKIIAQGDLTHQIQAKDRKDEIGAVISAVKTMVGSTASLVKNAKASVATVSAMAQEVGATSEQLNAGMEQVATATQQISQGAQKLSVLSQETVQHVNTLSSILQQTGGNTETGVRVGKESVSLMEKIRADSGKASESIEQIKESQETTTQTVEEMHGALEKIGELANLVTDVASQTEMLALNAAIEAARAGEAGRGFAVVADAVKELSEQSSQASKETLESVSKVQTKGRTALDVAKKSSTQASEGALVVKTSIEGTRTAAESIGKINQMMTEISTGVKKGITAIEGVVKAIDEVSAISQESAAACEENSSALEEQAASMNQLTTSAARLADVATQLQKEIDKFKV